MRQKLLCLFAVLVMGLTVRSQVFDATFGSDGKIITDMGVNTTMFNTAVLEDGKIIGLIIRPFSVNGNLTLVRYNANGSIDTLFGQQGFANCSLFDEVAFIDKLKILPDGKILICGTVAVPLIPGPQNFNFAVCRFNANGTPDTTFGTGGIASVNISQISELPYALDVADDGKIIVAGDARTSSSSYRRVAVTRFLPNGSVDNNFGVAGSVILESSQNYSEGATTVKILSNGKILLIGNSTDNSIGIANLLVARLNADGTLDNSYGSNGKQIYDFTYSQVILSSSITDDGSIFATGYLPDTMLGGLIVKLTPDGNLDTSFGDGGKLIPTGVGLIANVVQQGETLYFGGTIVGGVSTLFQMRAYDLEGNVIPEFGEDGVFIFGMTEGSEDFGAVLTMQPDGKILLCGRTGSGQNSNSALVRLELESLSTQQLSTDSLSFGPNPFNDQVTVYFPFLPSTTLAVDLIDYTGKTIAQNLATQNSAQSVNVNMPPGLSKGLYFLVLTHDGTKSVLKIVKE